MVQLWAFPVRESTHRSIWSHPPLAAGVQSSCTPRQNNAKRSFGQAYARRPAACSDEFRRHKTNWVSLGFHYEIFVVGRDAFRTNPTSYEIRP